MMYTATALKFVVVGIDDVVQGIASAHHVHVVAVYMAVSVALAHLLKSMASGLALLLHRMLL